MTATPNSFRQSFKEFANAETYPPDDVALWLDIAYKMLNASRWGNILDLGAQLFAAHNLALEARAKKEAENGAPPGGNVGPITSKSVDKVSVSYDTASGIEPDAGHWNLTIFGTRFIKMARMMGAGPVQVGAGGCIDPLSSANAWSGPWASTIPNPSQ